MSATTAKQPLALPPVVITGVVLALLVMALGVVGMHDTLHAVGAVDGSPWTGWFAQKAQQLDPSPWMLWAGPLAVVIGLVLVISALLPRRRTHLAVGEGGVFIGSRDLGRIVTDAATSTPAVTEVKVSVRTHSVDVVATTIATDTQHVSAQMEEAVTARLDAVTSRLLVHSHVSTKKA